jgi:nucleotide-binding universal stress UspA family protein
MTIRSVFLFTSTQAGEIDRGPGAFAISLARSHQAYLTIFAVALDVTSPGHQTDASAVASGLQRAAQTAGVSCEVITTHSHALGVHEVIAEHARLHDICVAGCGSSGVLTERQVTEYLLCESGRPVIVVPQTHSEPYRAGDIALGWDNTAAAARALGDTLALLGPDRLHLLTVTGEKPLPTDLNTDRLVETISRRGVIADHNMVPLGSRTIARALQGEAEVRGATLLSMGAKGHSRLRRIVFGSATTDFLADPRLPTLLSR